MTRRAKFGLLGTIAVVVAAAVVAVLWYMIRDNPEVASVEGALAGRTTTTLATADTTADAPGSESPSPSETPGTESTDLDGTWTMSGGGGFDFSSSTGTFAGFRVKEELAGVGSTEAIGRTGDVSGSMTISAGQVTEATFTVDLTTIRSNDARRATQIQRALETSKFPSATFTLTKPIALPANASTGRTVKVVAVGDLTIHGVTRSVKFPLEAKRSDTAVAVAGSLDVAFDDFGVKVPDSRIVLSVEDHGPIELQLLLERG